MAIYFGREVKALIPRGAPVVQIDVMQKDGDCPKEYSRAERMNCINDCQDTFATFMYSILEKKIVGMGALARMNPSFHADIMKKHNLTYEQASALVKSRGEGLRYEQFPAKINVYYKGDLLVSVAKCEFQVGDIIWFHEPELKQYFDLILGDPIKIMEECGVRFVRKENLEMIVYDSEENRCDLPKPLIPDSAEEV